MEEPGGYGRQLRALNETPVELNAAHCLLPVCRPPGIAHTSTVPEQFMPVAGTVASNAIWTTVLVSGAPLSVRRHRGLRRRLPLTAAVFLASGAQGPQVGLRWGASM